MKTKIAYYVGTGLLTALILGSAGMYIFNHDAVAEIFIALGYPTYLIYPLATAKILGLVAIWSGVSTRLRYMAYAGFFFNFVLGAMAHLGVGDGQAGGALVALGLLAVSYFARSRIDAAGEARQPDVAAREATPAVRAA